MAIPALQATPHAAAKFVIRNMKNDREGFALERLIKCHCLRNGAGKAIEQPTVILFSDPLEDHRDHDVIGDIIATFQKRAGELSEIGIIAKGAP